MTDQAILKRRQAVEDLPPLRDVIAAHQLSAQKKLGQNFLLDINITDKIVREACHHDGGAWQDAHVFEIGSGPGGLTRSLLKSEARQVTAIEFDTRAVAALGDLKNAVGDDLYIIQGDALKTNLIDLAPAPRVIVANLPYNIATPLLISWLRQMRSDPQAFQSMSLMFQKEVAERILARPDTKTYGRLSVITQWLCHVNILYDLPPSAFTPPPKVNSAVVHFKPKQIGENSPDFHDVERLTAAAFNQKRKMIRSSLKDYMPVLEALGIDTQKRAENLTVDEYLAIASY
tara:strand:- start:15704 stop:16567 length:864 start_codon:yes stop_codon:yes gene_type:complete